MVKRWLAFSLRCGRLKSILLGTNVLQLIAHWFVGRVIGVPCERGEYVVQQIQVIDLSARGVVQVGGRADLYPGCPLCVVRESRELAGRGAPLRHRRHLGLGFFSCGTGGHAFTPART